MATLDDFTSLLGLNDARMMVDLLILAVAGRAGDNAKETITNVLVGENTLLLLYSFCYSHNSIL